MSRQPELTNAETGARRTYCETIALTRWGAYISSMESRAILWASEIAGAPQRALEIGCEGGRWSKMLSDRGWSVVCTDINHEMLSLCKQRIPGATCIPITSGDTCLPCNDATVRLVLCIEVAPVVQATWFIDEAFRVLEPGGILVATFWNSTSLRGFFAHCKAAQTRCCNYYSLKYAAWRRQLKTTGFRLLREEGFCWFPLSRASNSLLAPLFTRLEKYLGLRKLVRISPWVILVARRLE